MSMLSDLIMHSRVDQSWDFSGLDSIEWCKDKEHFKNFPGTISYKYNSRGFRDNEWSSDINTLSNSIWCLGDSFTVGLGSCIEHTWPHVLAHATGISTINVSLDGASNQWIARRACDIIQTIRPKNMVILWSYLHRREHADPTLDDEDRRIMTRNTSDSEDLDNLYHCVSSVTKFSHITNLVHATIPRATLTDPLIEIPGISSYIGEVPQLDLARDGLHFDIKTSKWIAENVEELLI